MSIASSVPCMKIPTSTPSTCSSSSSTSSTFRFSVTKPSIVAIRSSQTDGPIRRPVAPPPLREPSPPPSSPSPPLKPTPPSPPSSSSASPSPIQIPTVSSGAGSNVITLEFQRQTAKELQAYFKQKKLEEASQGPFFGFLSKNEITNGRYAQCDGLSSGGISKAGSSIGKAWRAFGAVEI